jgi:microcystin-dependent protein
MAGQEFHTLTISEMPAHTHLPQGSTAQPDSALAANNLWATQTINMYNTTPNSLLNPVSVTVVGGSQPHENRQPYLVLNFCIALQGIFPSQN